MERATTDHRAGNAPARYTNQDREQIEATRPTSAAGSTDKPVYAPWTQQQLVARAPLFNEWDEA